MWPLHVMLVCTQSCSVDKEGGRFWAASLDPFARNPLTEKTNLEIALHMNNQSSRHTEALADRVPAENKSIKSRSAYSKIAFDFGCPA